MSHMNHAISLALLGASIALGCATESSQSSAVLRKDDPPSDLEVVTPDGRTFHGGPARVQVTPLKENTWEDKISFGAFAGGTFAGKSSSSEGNLQVYVELEPTAVATPGVLEAPISSPGPRAGALNGKWVNLGTATVMNEHGQLTSGLVHVELNAGRLTGRVETTDGTYQLRGRYAYECFKWGIPSSGGTDEQGSPYALISDESLETPLCKRFSSLRVPGAG